MQCPTDQARIPTAHTHHLVRPAPLKCADKASSHWTSHCFAGAREALRRKRVLWHRAPTWPARICRQCCCQCICPDITDWADSSAAHRTVGEALMQAGWQAQPSSHSCRLASTNECSHQCFSRLLSQHSIPRPVSSRRHTSKFAAAACPYCRVNRCPCDVRANHRQAHDVCS